MFNPLNWIKSLLLSDYVGAAVRHILTAIGAYLISKGLADAATASTWVEDTVRLLTSPAFLTGVIALFTGGAASVINKAS